MKKSITKFTIKALFLISFLVIIPTYAICISITPSEIILEDSDLDSDR